MSDYENDPVYAVPGMLNPALPNEHEVTERARAEHANYAMWSGDWTGYYACWDTVQLGRMRTRD